MTIDIGNTPTLRGRGSSLSVPDAAKALRKAKGNITEASKILGCSRPTLYGRVQSSKRLKRILEDERERFVDKAEGALERLVEEGNVTAVTFALRKLGSSRGWGDRMELTGDGGGPVEVNITRHVIATLEDAPEGEGEGEGDDPLPALTDGEDE